MAEELGNNDAIQSLKISSSNPTIAIEFGYQKRENAELAYGKL